MSSNNNENTLMEAINSSSAGLPAETIQMAAGDGDLQAVKNFVQSKGISVDDQDEYGYSPLHAACSYCNVDIAQWLLENGATVDIKDFEGDTPLAVCENTACADLLLSKGANLFTVNHNQATPYHIAVWECRQEMIDWLTVQYQQRNVPLPEVGNNPDEEDDAENDGNYEDIDDDENPNGMQEDKN